MFVVIDSSKDDVPTLDSIIDPTVTKAMTHYNNDLQGFPIQNAQK